MDEQGQAVMEIAWLGVMPGMSVLGHGFIFCQCNATAGI